MIIIPRKNIFLKVSIFLIGLSLSLLLFYIDYIVFSPEITFTLTYLLPIIFVAWYAGRYWGLFLSFICITEWVIVKIFSDKNVTNLMLFFIDLILKSGVYFFIIYLLSRLKKSLEIERKIARTDYLTGAANRKAFSEKLEIELYRSNRNNSSLAIAYFDIDNFKSINDHFGHKTGDDLLVKTAAVVTRNIRKIDLLARIGGDEFIILFPDTNYDQSKITVEKLKNKISAIMKLNKWPSSISAGVGIFYNGNYKVDYIINQVDGLMYQVKTGTKDGIIFKEYKKDL